MTFYLKPPQGVLPLSTLQTCVRERFQYLQALLRDEETNYVPKNFDYLMEGTSMDRAGHFLLRLISLSLPNFQEFMIAAETKFFSLRLNSYNSSQDIRALLKMLHRHAVECSAQPNLSKNYHTFLVSVKYVTEKMILKHVAIHVFTQNHLASCSEYSITMHFTMCLPMIRLRKVDLQGGNALIPCGLWKELLALFFYEHIQFGIEQLCSTGCRYSALQDPRIKDLTNELGINFKYNKCLKTENYLKASEVKKENVFFPPCMRHLYQNLETKRRLAHEARRYFTLFLKDAGMPLEEAITFWSEEYSHPQSCSSCNHSWQRDSKRYIYSIRHMYGLEGGRYNYSVPSCRKIQAMSSTTMAEGGCPFVYFDDPQLKASLVDDVRNNDVICNKILQHTKDDNPHKACELHFSTLSKQMRQDAIAIETEPSKSKISNPIQYYNNLKRLQGNSHLRLFSLKECAT